MSVARLFALASILTLTACGGGLRSARVDVVRDASDNVATISSGTLLLGESSDHASLVLRCGGAECSGNGHVTARFELNLLTFESPEGVFALLDVWRMPLVVKSFRATPLAVGYHYSIDAEVPLGLLMQLAGEPNARFELFTIEGVLHAEHREEIRAFVDEVLQLRQSGRQVASL